MKSTALLFALALPLPAAIQINLPGSTESGTWNSLNTTNYPGYGSFGTAANPWPAPIAARAGSSGALLNKIAGSGYVSSANFVYTAGAEGVFSLTDNAPLAGLRTIVFQGAISGDITAVTLNYNGNSLALPANFFALNDNPAPAYDDYAWQWDLSGVAEPIDSYEIVFAGHIAYTSLQVDAANSFAQAVPEASTATFGLAALGLTFIRRRRA